MIDGYGMLGSPTTSCNVDATIKHFTNGDNSVLNEGCLVVLEKRIKYIIQHGHQY
jgi:hypothetical protein